MKAKKDIKLTSAFVLFLTLCALPAGAATVIDAKGNPLGTLLDTNGPTSLEVFVSSTTTTGFTGVAVLDIDTSKSQGTIGWSSALSSVWYASADCTGAPYASAIASGYPVLSSIGGKFFVLDYKNASAKKTMTPQSVLSAMGCHKLGVIAADLATILAGPLTALPIIMPPIPGPSGNYYPVLEIPASALPFTVPFSTPLHFQ